MPSHIRCKEEKEASKNKDQQKTQERDLADMNVRPNDKKIITAEDSIPSQISLLPSSSSTGSVLFLAVWLSTSGYGNSRIGGPHKFPQSSVSGFILQPLKAFPI